MVQAVTPWPYSLSYYYMCQPKSSHVLPPPPPTLLSLGEDIFIYRAVAFDRDEGRNAEIKYVLRNAKRTPNIRVDSATGKIFSTAELTAGQNIELQVSSLVSLTQQLFYICKATTSKRGKKQLFLTLFEYVVLTLIKMHANPQDTEQKTRYSSCLLTQFAIKPIP